MMRYDSASKEFLVFLTIMVATSTEDSFTNYSYEEQCALSYYEQSNISYCPITSISYYE
jgi:hypothetical protein